MKSTKSKTSVKIAKGTMARAMVLRGRRTKTTGGLTRNALTKNKRGKIVSKRASTRGKQMYKHIKAWTECVTEARKLLRVKGFVVINGKTSQGKALYTKAKQIYAERHH